MKDILFLYKKMFTVMWQMIFCNKRKIILIGYPTHANLGDQAQLLCTKKWLKSTFPDGKLIAIPCHSYLEGNASYLMIMLWSLAFSFIFGFLRFTVRKNDVFVGHSGYYLVDHHGGWHKFVYVARKFPHHRFLILPQTFNMYNPYFTKVLAEAFNSNDNITLLCRDEVSYEKAKQIINEEKLMLYPDIVTSLIGTKSYDNKREGVLFCMRNDVEAFYSKDSISKFRARFNCKTALTDTTIYVSEKEMAKDRQKLVFQKIEEFSHYKLIITDRYHGTIFSQIAATPLIVIASADHKLSSGVKWFPKDLFKSHIYYAKSLEEAYDLAKKILRDNDIKYSVPTYFKDKYWDKLADYVR